MVGIGGRIGRNRTNPEEKLSDGGQLVLNMIKHNYEQKYSQTTLQFISLAGPETSPGNNVEYYTVKMKADPPLSDECSFALVMMRYTDFEHLWSTFSMLHEYGQDMMPEKRGLGGKLKDIVPWIDTSAEIAESRKERREIFESLLHRIFRGFGGKVHLHTHVHGREFGGNAGGLARQLISSFYSSGDEGHITAMHIGHVRDMYDCISVEQNQAEVAAAEVAAFDDKLMLK